MAQIRRHLVAPSLFAGLWVILAVARPTTTFHLAPLIVALWPALTAKDPKSAAAASSGIGLFIALAVTALLSATGLLQGPSLFPWGGPALESVVAAGVGAMLGLIPALSRGRESEA